MCSDIFDVSKGNKPQHVFVAVALWALIVCKYDAFNARVYTCGLRCKRKDTRVHTWVYIQTSKSKYETF